jgi:hypothetical protein
MDKPNFFNIHKDENYKNAIIDALTGGIPDQFMEYYEMTLNYIIEQKYHLFDKPEFEGSLYENEDDTLDLILPSIRRVFGKVFIDTPRIFQVSPEIMSIKGYIPDGRLELFQLHYNIDEFIDYLIEYLNLSKNCLERFEYIDKTATTLEIIVDNYISMLIKRVLDSEDIKKDTRDLKIKKMIND